MPQSDFDASLEKMLQSATNTKSYSYDELFDRATEKFIKEYVGKKFATDLQEHYGNIIGVLKAGVLAGADFAKKFYEAKEKSQQESNQKLLSLAIKRHD